MVCISRTDGVKWGGAPRNPAVVLRRRPAAVVLQGGGAELRVAVRGEPGRPAAREPGGRGADRPYQAPIRGDAAGADPLRRVPRDARGVGEGEGRGRRREGASGRDGARGGDLLGGPARREPADAAVRRP